MLDEHRLHRFNARLIVVGPGFAAAQYQMARFIARGRNNRGNPLLGDGKKMVGMGRRFDGIQRDLDRAAGAVFKTHGHRQARGEFAVDLRLGGTRTDGPPSNQVREVLRRNRVKKLGASGQPNGGQIQQ